MKSTMSIKRISVILVTLVFVLSFAACGQQNNANQETTAIESSTAGTSTNAASTAGEKPIKLVWAGWSGEEDASKPVIQGMVKSWNDENPNATVEWIGWPWGETLKQLTIRLQGGEQIDVAQIDLGWLKTIGDMDVLNDFTTLIDPSWIDSNIEASLLKNGQFGGKQVTLPWTLASVGMVYNPDILAKAGVAEVPQTIAQFEEALEKIRNYDKSIIPFGFCTKDSTMTGDFVPWLWSFGGSFFGADGSITINNEQGIKTVTWLKGLFDKGYIKMDIARADSRQLYAQNKIGFYCDAISAKGTLQSNGVAAGDLDKYIKPMLRPVLNSGDTPQSTMWGHLTGIFKSSQNPQKAAEFVQHMLSEEQSINYFKTVGMLPVLKSAIQNAAVQNDPWSKEWAQITNLGRTQENYFYAEKAALDTAVFEELQAALLGSKTPKQAVDDIANRYKTTIK